MSSLAFTVLVDSNNPQLHTSEVAYLKAKAHPHGGRLRAYRSVALSAVLAQCRTGKKSCNELDIYEFGVYTGISMHQILWAMDTRSVKTNLWRGEKVTIDGAGAVPRRLWGFDSFAGLPEETALASSYVHKHHFIQGAWNGQLAMGAESRAELIDKVASYLNDSRVQLVPGFYNESLTNDLAKKMRPALYVDVDCDLYSSTVTALVWLFDHGLVQVGTVIGYDDWAQGGISDGEQRAHAEVKERYGVTFKSLGTPYGGAAFQVTGCQSCGVSHSTPTLGTSLRG